MEVDAVAELEGFSSCLRFARRFDTGLWVVMAVVLISRYFLVVGLSGAVKLKTIH